jgi:hypothetical protein
MNASHRRLLEVATLTLGVLGASASVAEIDVRLKAFGSSARLPDGDLQRDLDGSPANDVSVDLRTLFAGNRGGIRLTADHTVVYEGGDSFAFVRSPLATLDQTPTDDERRFFDLTWEIEDGASHRTVHRFDRLALEYRGADWGMSLGRRAVSWGSGIVFQPLDLFAPFAPTTVDRDYKPGEDMVLFDRLNAGGSDLQLLGVFRRDESGDRDVDAASFGGKWRGHFGDRELELVAGRHYRDAVAGGSLRLPIGTAMLRSDVLVTDVDDGDTFVSALLNVDYSLLVAGRNVYLFGELHRNGFGVGEDEIDLTRIPERLRVRLERGEVFNLMRHYLAVGTNVEWHPLWTQSLTIIGNLDDGSALVQTELRWEPSDTARFDFGVIDSRGRRGKEYGAIPLPLPGEPTTGGDTTAYLRFVWYW